jgi:alpha-ketoglutarate-dependent 2,4-dichlorophenoxyacetate dioxygenase
LPLTVYPITETFAAEVGDVDLSQPLSAEDEEAIKQAFWKYSVLIFAEQHLTQDQHVAFAEHFGPIETDTAQGTKESQARLGTRFADVSNLSAEGKIWDDSSRQRMFQMGNRLWHTDSTFKRRPALCSLLYARTIAPIGGHTEFADQRAAYDALPEPLKVELKGLIVEHSIFTSRARLGFTDFPAEDFKRLPPVPQALVRTIPQSGRRSLYVASHAGRVLGMPDADGRKLIDDLIAHTTQRQFVYTHRWRLNDLVLWDNRCTMHRGTAFDDLRWRRDVQRATISDVANSCEQEGLRVPE